jgi:hypothetical protein
VGQLWRRIAAKKTNAGSRAVNCINNCLRRNPWHIRHFLVLPVLTEQAIKRATVVKHSEILEPVFWSIDVRKLRESGMASASAHPVGHTICRKPVKVPGYFSISNRCTLQLTARGRPDATVPGGSFSERTPVHTDAARLAI